MEQQKGYGTVSPPYGQQLPPVQPSYGHPNPNQFPYGQHIPQPNQPQNAYQQPPSQQTVVVSPTRVAVVGGCPVCGGYLRDEFTVIGIILAILFFPIGILCCLMMTEKRCSKCGR